MERTWKRVLFSYKNRPDSTKNDILKIKGEYDDEISFRCGTVANRKTWEIRTCQIDIMSDKESENLTSATEKSRR